LKNLIPLYFLYAFAKLNSALCLQGVEFTFSNEGNLKCIILYKKSIDMIEERLI